MIKLLTLTYPLTPVTPAACGGAEQIALQVLTGCARSTDLEITWVGAAGSLPIPGIRFIAWEDLLARHGFASPRSGQTYPPHQLLELQQHCEYVAGVLARSLAASLHLIHNQGAFFARKWPTTLPVLLTLHLARTLYPLDLLDQCAPNQHFQCVSGCQYAGYGSAACCGYIPNGIDLGQFPARPAPAPASAPLLYLGRICPEKAPHVAIAIARQAHRQLRIVGGVAPFPAHQHYFASRIQPELDRDVQWLPPPSLEQKRRFLAEAAAVVIPSEIAETSSVVAMEAAASGVPVLAVRRGALPEIVAEGETGWLGGVQELATAAARLHSIEPAACRQRAERLFSADRMVAAYLALYRRLAGP